MGSCLRFLLGGGKERNVLNGRVGYDAMVDIEPPTAAAVDGQGGESFVVRRLMCFNRDLLLCRPQSSAHHELYVALHTTPLFRSCGPA